MKDFVPSGMSWTLLKCSLQKTKSMQMKEIDIQTKGQTKNLNSEWAN